WAFADPFEVTERAGHRESSLNDRSARNANQTKHAGTAGCAGKMGSDCSDCDDYWGESGGEDGRGRKNGSGSVDSVRPGGAFAPDFCVRSRRPHRYRIHRAFPPFIEIIRTYCTSN